MRRKQQLQQQDIGTKCCHGPRENARSVNHDTAVRMYPLRYFFTLVCKRLGFSQRAVANIKENYHSNSLDLILLRLIRNRYNSAGRYVSGTAAQSTLAKLTWGAAAWSLRPLMWPSITLDAQSAPAASLDRRGSVGRCRASLLPLRLLPTNLRAVARSVTSARS